MELSPAIATKRMKSTSSTNARNPHPKAKRRVATVKRHDFWELDLRERRRRKRKEKVEGYQVDRASDQRRGAVADGVRKKKAAGADAERQLPRCGHHKAR